MAIINRINPPPYLRRVDTGDIFPYNPYFLDVVDLQWEAVYDPPFIVNEAVSPGTVFPEEGETEDVRLTAIADAVSQIDPTQYSKPQFGRPAMPKVADVSAICGFDVTADEILAVMPKE